MTYRVYRDKAVVGNATLVPDGLYYHIHCRCKAEAGAVVRIVACCETGRENIGICLPVGDCMEIHTRIARKKLQNIAYFEATASGEDVHWLPLTEGEPISDLSEVIYSRLEVRNGRIGLLTEQHRPNIDL